MEISKTCVVLVTGGAGFLGQHVVGLLQERADHVTEIRVLDVVPYTNKLDYVEKKPVEGFVGSITDRELMNTACSGVDCVMHVASIVDTSLIPDEQLSYNINVEGTRNVIEACQKNGVRRLLYCSTVEVVTGTKNIYNGTENNTSYVTNHLFKPYGPTKAEAERLVLAANSDSLQTLALRPAVLFGELEWRSLGYNATGFLAKNTGFYVRIDCENGLAEHVYVGNVAWGFVCAEINLYKGKINESSTGKSYFITDDSPKRSLYGHMDAVLAGIGLKPCPFVLPLWLIVYPLYLLFIILSLISTVYRVNFFVGISSFLSLKRVYLFSYNEAKERLGYEPLYTYDEAVSRTVKYFKIPSRRRA